jgi:hypothetical protein
LGERVHSLAFEGSTAARTNIRNAWELDALPAVSTATGNDADLVAELDALVETRNAAAPHPNARAFGAD